MRWSYKTVHYELKKEGLLGSTFIDESEVEQSLNEYGKAGWELISILETLDGIIAVFKQPLGEGIDEYSIGGEIAAKAPIAASKEFDDSLLFREPDPMATETTPPKEIEKEHVAFEPLDEVFKPEEQRESSDDKKTEDDVGSIRIE